MGGQHHGGGNHARNERGRVEKRGCAGHGGTDGLVCLQLHNAPLRMRAAIRWPGRQLHFKAVDLIRKVHRNLKT
jgi:hypothetical protein